MKIVIEKQDLLDFISLVGGEVFDDDDSLEIYDYSLDTGDVFQINYQTER